MGNGPPVGGGGGRDTASMPGAQTQQIFIPNALVGASKSPSSSKKSRTWLIIVIGKAGAKINEIRQASQCQVRVTDPGTPAIAGSEPNPEERLVTITGLPHNINTAVQMLYARLEQEKQKSMA
jgi:heterogeneous nuclear rnp K-like protein 2